LWGGERGKEGKWGKGGKKKAGWFVVTMETIFSPTKSQFDESEVSRKKNGKVPDGKAK